MQKRRINNRTEIGTEIGKEKDPKTKRRIKTHPPHRKQLRNYETGMAYAGLKNFKMNFHI